MAEEMKVINQDFDLALLKPGAVVGVYLDAKKREWKLLGKCAGPKIVYRDDDGNEAVKWLAPLKVYSLTDEEVAKLIKNPKRGKRFRLAEEPQVNKKFLMRFFKIQRSGPRRGKPRRYGCEAKVYVPTAKLDGLNREVACSKCGGIAGFWGEPPPGSLAAEKFAKSEG